MQEYIEETESGIYRLTSDGKLYSQSKLKIPLVGKGMEFTGEFKIILKPEKRLKTYVNNRGYEAVAKGGTTYMIHKLVALAFIPNPENKKYVNHKDGNKLNNSVKNLEWCTIAENNRHARETGLHKQARGHKIKYSSQESRKRSLENLQDNSALTDDDVRYVRSVYIPRSKGFSATALAHKYGVTPSSMCSILKGKTYKHVV